MFIAIPKNIYTVKLIKWNTKKTMFIIIWHRFKFSLYSFSAFLILHTVRKNSAIMRSSITQSKI